MYVLIIMQKYFLFILDIVSGCVPLDQHLSMSLEEGKNFITENSDSPAVMALTSVVDRLIQIDKNL